jgi:HSF-type DNA-binding
MRVMSNHDDDNVHRVLQEYLRIQRLSQSIYPVPAAALLRQAPPQEVYGFERSRQDALSTQQYQRDAAMHNMMAPVAQRPSILHIPEFAADSQRMRFLSTVPEPALATSLSIIRNHAIDRNTMLAPLPSEFARLQQQQQQQPFPEAPTSTFTPFSMSPAAAFPSLRGSSQLSVLQKPIQGMPRSHEEQHLLPGQVAAKHTTGKTEASDAASASSASEHLGAQQQDELAGDTHQRQHLLTTNVGPGAFFQAKKRRKYRHESFPEKLYRMLEETSEAGSEDIVSFTSSGKAFEIYRIDAFLEEIIPKFFRHKSISSFRRQLSMYGFRRVKDGPDHGAYFHELFVRGQPDLCRQMKRVAELELVLPSSSSRKHS